MSAPAIEDVLALSPLQEGLFALYRLTQDGVDLYTMQLRVDIEGMVGAAQVELLRRSATAMLERHPNLRASFWDQDVPKPVQIVPTEVELPWLERTAPLDEFDAIARSERRRPFDLTRGPAMRVVLLTAPGQTRRRLIFTVHHILMDGWALAVFFTEMLAVYRAGGSLDGLPAPRPYRDYIAWLATQDTEEALSTWTRYLSRVSGPLMLAGATKDGVPESNTRILDATHTGRLRDWAGRSGLTLNTAVQFAWAVLLSRLTDRRDVVFGTIVSGRPEQLSGVESMVGLFINSVPVVHEVSGTEPVTQQCLRLQRECSTMRDIGYLSLSQLQRADGRGALFDTMFVFENAPLGDVIASVTTPDGTTFTPIDMESLTHYPLTVVAHASGDELVVVVEAIADALPQLPADEICARLIGLLTQLPDIGTAGPDALDVLTDIERADFADLAARVEPQPADTVWQVFERQATATPDAVALTTTGGAHYTYAQLHEHACRLANELTERGVGPETVVALALPRGDRSIIAILAVLASGAAYLPVDISLPQARIDSILGQAVPVLAVADLDHARLVAALGTVVIDDPVVSQSISGRSAEPPVVARHPLHSAYVIFTSGSTGEPKGVVGTNAALLGYFADHRDRAYRTAGKKLRIAHAWSLSFDASWQPLVGLLDGHSNHLFDAEEMRDAQQLVTGMADHRVDMIDTTPSMFVQLRAAGLLERPLSVLALGGEAIDTELWQELRSLEGTSVFNCYGPTETTVEAVVAPVAQYPSPTIGSPNAGTYGYVLDSALREVPYGVIGELYLSGVQLTRGYVSRSALTATRFVADPFRPGRRMYRTGDLVRRLPHGGYAYLGRADSQTKIRGYRIEVDEIEAAMRAQQQVHDAAVAVVRRDNGAVLVGFVVWQPGTDADPTSLRVALADRLPSYMVPARIVPLTALPVNSNGKLDGHLLDLLARQSLSEVRGDGAASATTDTEKALGELFAEHFHGLVPHVDDDFFELGMDSIVAIALVNSARRRGLLVSPRMMLRTNTIRSLATAIDTAAADAQTGRDPDLADHGEVLPLPMVSWLCEHGGFRRFTHNFLLRLPREIDRAAIETVLQYLLDGHGTLRSTLSETSMGPRLVTRAPGTVQAADLLGRIDLPHASEDELIAAIEVSAREAIEQIDPHTGSMLRAVWFHGPDSGDVLLLSAHHLTVDVVSWHIMAGDLVEAWRCLPSGVAPTVLPEFTSYRRWSELMWQRAGSPDLAKQSDYWSAVVRDPDPVLGARLPDATTDFWSSLQMTQICTPIKVTERVLAALSRDEGVRELLLAATAMTMASWRLERQQDPAAGTLIALEGHGRADALVDADTTNTVGSFIMSYPVRLGVGGDAVDVDRAERNPQDAATLLAAITAQLRAVPNEGLDYGLLRYIAGVSELQGAAEPQILFSYLGRLDLAGSSDQPWSLLTAPYSDALPIIPEPDLPLRFALQLGVLVSNTPDGPQLVTNLRWSRQLFTADEIERLTVLWQRSIAALADAVSV